MCQAIDAIPWLVVLMIGFLGGVLWARRFARISDR